MSKVINLATYRGKSRKAYLAKHGGRLDRFLERFVRLNVDVDFRQLTLDYQSGGYGVSEAAWDYVQFREILAEAFDEAFGSTLYRQLRQQRWFDGRLITQDEIIERCLSSYIMSNCHYAITS